MLFTYSICISAYTVSLEMHNLYKWYTTRPENESLFSEENKNLFKNLFTLISWKAIYIRTCLG